MKLKIIDLFAGAGGFTLGFKQFKSRGKAVFDTVWANDFNKDATETYNANFGAHCTYGDIVGDSDEPDHLIPGQADHQFRGKLTRGFRDKLTTLNV